MLCWLNFKLRKACRNGFRCAGEEVERQSVKDTRGPEGRTVKTGEGDGQISGMEVKSRDSLAE